MLDLNCATESGSLDYSCRDVLLIQYIYTFSFYWNVNAHFFRGWSPRQVVRGAQILSSRNPPVDQIHNLTSCFDDLSTKRCSEDVTDKKAENESPAWTIQLCDVGWRGHQSIEIKIYDTQDPKNKDENTPTSWQM